MFLKEGMGFTYSRFWDWVELVMMQGGYQVLAHMGSTGKYVDDTVEWFIECLGMANTR